MRRDRREFVAMFIRLILSLEPFGDQWGHNLGAGRQSSFNLNGDSRMQKGHALPHPSAEGRADKVIELHPVIDMQFTREEETD
jgi:hypothetical protein